MGKDIFKNKEARERQEDWYQRFLARANCETNSTSLSTTFGEIHVLTAGDPSKPPIVCLHAMLTSSAHLLSEIRHLTDHFYLLMPDIPGHSVKAIPERLSFKGNDHAVWLGEILDGFELEKVPVFGVSLGGFIAHTFASEFLERVSKLALLVPAGIVQASVVKGLMSMAIPMIKYKMNASEENLRNLVNFLITEWDDDWGHFLGDSMNDFKTPRSIPPLAADEDLQNLTMPVLAITAE
ncbi:MAG: alpha/beta fold hydrolase, partial [Gracilimonas sp.]|nr:alpha/beta fold hydrolase [Gracilimonas sp.]